MSSSDLSPVVLFVYKRPEHTRKTLEALEKNVLAKDTELIIFSDGPKEKEDYKIVQSVRKVISRSLGFKNVEIYMCNYNKGLSNSIIDGLSGLFQRYNSLIILEDDIITDRYFLQYMNESLVYYSNHERVFSVAGYNDNVFLAKGRVHFLSKGTSWGWGTWRRVWEKVEFRSDKLKDMLRYSERRKFNFAGYDYMSMLDDQIENRIDSWAIRFYASSFVNGGLHLTPPRTMTENIGFDGSGTHKVPILNKNITVSNEGVNFKIRFRKIGESRWTHYIMLFRSYLMKVLNKV